MEDTNIEILVEYINKDGENVYLVNQFDVFYFINLSSMTIKKVDDSVLAFQIGYIFDEFVENLHSFVFIVNGMEEFIKYNLQDYGSKYLEEQFYEFMGVRYER